MIHLKIPDAPKVLLILSVHPPVLQEIQNTSRNCGYSRVFNGRRQLRHACLSFYLSVRPPARME